MKRFEIRLSKELHEKLREESFITEKSMHEIVIELIEEHYNKKEDLLMKLVELNEGTRKELIEGTLQEIVDYLKDNPDLYTWQLDNDPEAEMPELDNIETLRELEHELDKIDLGWWTLTIE
jgi:predicted DNA-binding protein